jgi:hypothetical protein
MRTSFRGASATAPRFAVSCYGASFALHPSQAAVMHLDTPPPAVAHLGLRALKAVATTDGPIRPAQRALLEAACDVVLHISADIDALPPVTPAELAAGFPDPALRRQFVDGLLVVALADGVPSRQTTATVAAYAEALGVDGPELGDLRRLTEHDMLLFKLDFLRRSQVGDIMRDQLDQHGILGLARGVLGLRGLAEDADLAARYRAWERLPDGTLGRALSDYYRSNGFALPGERFGFPEAGVYHDFSHVLAGYSTRPEGEIEVASFTAGYKKRRPFYVVLFAVLTFSTGVDMRPSGTQHPSRGLLAEPGMARRMLPRLI